MASIPGSHYDVFVTTAQPVNFGVTSDPASLPAPVPGAFNLEVITDSTGTGSFSTAAGYQELAILSTDGKTLTALHGDYGIVDNPGGNDLIVLGDGNVSIGGASGDTVVGGSGASQFIDAHLGNQSVVGGSAGNETIWSGAGDTIRGDAGNETIGGVSGDTVIGGTGNEFIDASQGGQSITGGGAGNETIWAGVGDTINGGTGANVTIGGVAGDTIIGAGGNELIDADQGDQSVVGGSGNAILWGGGGDTVQGAAAGGSATIAFGAGRVSGQSETFWDDGTTSGGNDTVVDFTQSIGDRISLNSATDNPNSVLASASQDGSGNAVVHLADGSSITLMGVGLANLTSSYFSSH